MASIARRRNGQNRAHMQTAPSLPVQVAATSLFLPEQIVPNAELTQEGVDHQWIVQRTGIHERRIAPAEQSTSDLAFGAGQKCLEDAGVSPEEVDLILVATCTPDHIAPSTSCLVQERLGSINAAAFDVNAACSGFMYAYITGSQYVASGCFENVLVIGADVLSRTMNPKDRSTFPLFGDGAGAVLLQPAKPKTGATGVVGTDGNIRPIAAESSPGILGFQLGANGAMGGALLFPAGGSRQPINHDILDQGAQYLQMDGRTVFKWAVKKVPELINRLLNKLDFPIEDVSLFVLHQANTRILDAAMQSLGVEEDRVWSNVSRYGNTCAASVPLVLAEASQAGKIKSGDHVVMCGFGAGLTWGTALIRW